MKWLSLVFTALYWCYCCLLFAGAFAASCRFSPPLLWLVHLPPVVASVRRCYGRCSCQPGQSAVAACSFRCHLTACRLQLPLPPYCLPLTTSAATLLLAAASLSCSLLLWAVYCGLCICRELSLQSAVAVTGTFAASCRFSPPLLWQVQLSARAVCCGRLQLPLPPYCSLLPH